MIPFSKPSVAMLSLALGACGHSEPDVLQALAGTWSITALDESGDSITASILLAGEDTSAWTVTFPGRQPIAVHVLSVTGDSVVLRSDPYESVLQPGVRVTSENVLRARGDEMTGTWLSHRTVTGPDSLLRGNIRGRRQR